jgi:phage minor structural protein
MPLNAAYADEIVQIDSNTYQLTFRFPTSDPLWEKLKEETFLTADDLHGEQDFVIFEVEKKHGYIQVYANQVFTLLNNYVVNPISLDRQTGSTALSRFAGAITRNNPFSFFSDIEDRHTFNIGSKNAMEALAKDKHSIIGQWGGDLVRHGYQVRLLKNGGSENESLFMYKKNLSSYQHKTSTKSLKTRITFTTTVKGEGEKAPDRTFTVTIDSPLINKYSQIYEDVIEVNDQDVKDEASLRKYGEQYYRTSLCDMMEDSLELEVVGQSDVPVQMFDIVSLFHDVYNLDVRKKITKYTYSPMGKKLKTIGFGQFKSGLANAIGSVVSDAVKGEAQQLQSDFERQLARELKNADLSFDRKKEELVNQFTDGLNAAKAKAEEVKRELSDTIDQRFSSFNNGPLQEAKRRAEEALQNAGASSLLAQEAKRIGLDSITKLEEFKRQATSAQTALSGDLDALKRTVANDIRPKQAQAETEIAKQVEALSQAKKELAGVKSAQATYEETTTRRLAELTNLANGKASKSELTQTADELVSRIASVSVGGVNLFKSSRDFSGSWVNVGQWTKETEKYKGLTVMSRTGSWLGLSQPFEAKKGETYTFSFYIKSSAERDQANIYFVHNSTSTQARVSLNVSSLVISNEWQRLSATFKIEESGFILPRIERFNADNRVYVAGLKLEHGTIATDYNENPEDVDGRVSVVESNFKQRADSLEAGVSRLTEGLRTKADISSLNVTAENIRQSVKSLETDTQNKLNQKLSLAEFEVRASGIRQEILNATKDKADKALVTAEAGKLRTELSTVQAYVAQDGQRQEALRKYTREESAKQATSVRELVAREYVGKSTYQEDVRAIERKFEGITNPQNGSIATQIANYKTAVDGRFTEITSLLSGKANQVDFQRVRETSQLYERILGNTNNSISDNIARMALTNQLFQVEVGKYSVNGPNLVKNSDFKNGMNEWASTQNLGRLVKHDFYRNGQKDLMRLSNATKNENFLYSPRFDLERNTDYVLNFRGFNNSNLVSYDVFILGRRVGENNGFTIIKQVVSSKKLSTARCEDVSVTFNSGEMDNAFIRFDNNGSSSGTADLYITEIDLYKGYKPRAWQPHPEDVVTDANAKLEAIRTQMTLLQGSWSVQNINSAGDLISGINLGANGHNRFDGKLTHITGETLIDKAVIKSAMVDKLKTANFEAGSVTTVVLDAEAVTAEKLKVDQAFFNKLVANEAYLSQLFAKQAFINRVQSVAIDASQVRSGILSGDRIYGGTIRGTEINGTTITGNSRITIGDNGFLRPTQEGGLQIKVPETYSASKGIGVQLFGRNFGQIPKGMFIYNSPNWNGGNLIGESVADTLLTVKGLTSLCNLYRGQPMSGLPINSNFRYGDPVRNLHRISFIAWDSHHGQMYVNDGTDTDGTWWFKPDASSSDKRLKTNIQDTDFEATDFVKKLEFKQFDWKPDKFGYKKPYTNVGLIAQDVEKLDSSLVYSQGENLALDDFRLGNIALKAIQELSQRIEMLERKLA